MVRMEKNFLNRDFELNFDANQFHELNGQEI